MTLIYIIGILTLILLKFIFINRTKKGDDTINKRISWKSVSKVFSKSIHELKPCPKCGQDAEKLHWYFYSTSRESWQNLAGTKGYYSKCIECKICVEDIIIAMS
jgi:hypothetical protein